MHWDIVEVKPEPDYCLFIRFKDGLSGRVRLRREELTGALLCWMSDFSNRSSSIAARLRGPARSIWRRTQCTLGWQRRSELPRLYELRDLLSDPSHPDTYFRDFEGRLQDPSCFAAFAVWEKDLQSTDPVSFLNPTTERRILKACEIASGYC